MFVKLTAVSFLAFAGLVANVTSGYAITLDFNFSFDNAVNGGGTVTGIVRGLTDDATSAASSVEVLSNTSGYGIGEYIGNPLTNAWTVTAGVITDFEFLAFGADNCCSAVTTSSLDLEVNPFFGPSVAGLTHDPDSVAASDRANLTFTSTKISAVPVPAALPLMVLGLASLGATVQFGKCKRKNKRAAIA